MFGGFTLGTIMLGISPYEITSPPSYLSGTLPSGYYIRFNYLYGDILGGTLDQYGNYITYPVLMGEYVGLVDDSGEYGVV